MKIPANSQLLLTPLILAAIFFSGCKEKGCTDPRAVNYNSVATEDDGSCVICETSTSLTATKTAYLVDTYFSSPRYNQTVAIFTVEQMSTVYNNGICGSPSCDFIVTIQSLVNQNMQFQYQLSSSGGVYFNYYQNAALLPNETIVADTIFSNAVSNPCANFNFSTLSVYSSGMIYYW